MRAGCLHRRAQDRAQEVTGPYDEELQARFRELPIGREELRADMDRLNAEAASIACANPRVMQARPKSKKA